MDENIKKIITDLSNNIVIIEEKMSSKKDYKNYIEEVYDHLKAGFEHKELRECKVYFRFHKDKEIHEMQLRHYLTNLFFWEPLIPLECIDYLDESFIIDCGQLSSKYIKSYIDNKIIIPNRRKISNTKLNKIIHNMIFNLSRISTDFNILLGLSINIESFINIANRNPRFNEIIRTKIDKSMQPNEIESMLHGLLKEELEILMEEDSSFKAILRSGEGIKPNQLSEFSISSGLKPDLSGNTIPVPIDSNLLIGGLNGVSNYFIDSIGGRKALIMNKSTMGKAGHFSRKIMLVAAGEHLRKDEEDCNTVHPIKINITDKNYLKRFRDRYYRLPNEMKYKVLKGDEYDLIGKDIFIRSPLTCASKKGICKKCYGETLFYINRELMSIGAYAAAIFTNPIGQNILSSKHILTTTSQEMKFVDDFYKFFEFSSNEILLSNNIDDLEDYSLLIIHKNIVFINELDEGEYNKFLNIFHIKNNKTGEVKEIYELNNRSIYLSPEIIKSLNIGKKEKEVYEINFIDLPDSKLFLMEIENNELTRPLYSIMGLLDTKERRKQMHIETMDNITQKMIDLLIESDIHIQSVHAEVILRSLIRSKKDILERPDFSKYDSINDYQILTVESALENNPSITISLSFQFLNRQLSKPLTFRKKGTSYLDPFYKERP